MLFVVSIYFKLNSFLVICLHVIYSVHVREVSGCRLCLKRYSCIWRSLKSVWGENLQFLPLSLVQQIDGQMISLCLLVLQILITCSVLFWAMHLKLVLSPPCTQGYSWFCGRVYGFTVEPINGRNAYIPFPVSFFLFGNFLSSLFMSSCLCELYVCVCGFA